jgi:hypothetical protein
MARSRLNVERNYSSLSVKDLLEARDHYHWHLTHMQNVIGTAVGLYYVRVTDPEPAPVEPLDRRSPMTPASATPSGPVPPTDERTFDNSVVTSWSWPCVLVLVDRWMDPPGSPGSSARVLAPDDFVPRTLYLPDGRTVPTCVIKVEPTEVSDELPPQWTWPQGRAGGGTPLISVSQGREHIASVGALVTDGRTTFALTSRHVAGPVGQPVSTVLKGDRVPVGHAAMHQLTRRSFSEVYPEYVGRRTFLTLDAALVEVDDVDQWSSQTHGLPASGEVADLSEHNISTRLIDAEVVAYGAASGLLRGKVAALFYRSRSRGGYDDVTDFLIAPLPGARGSQPGDSGTVWHLVQGDEAPQPLALQWGGQRFGGGPRTRLNFALASSLTTVLRLLDVDLVDEHHTRAQPFWGKTGHYSIASLACVAVTNVKLAELLLANVDRISFGTKGLTAKHIDDATREARNKGKFVPLADVPDLIWKRSRSTPPMLRGAVRSTENANHFADVDEPGADGRTLLERCVEDPATQVQVAVWQEYFDSLGHRAASERGSLPFRVWQLFDEMVDAVRATSMTRYICAAGTLAHYVGDACQPLHGSVFANGIPDEQRKRDRQPLLGDGLHSSYEGDMVDRHYEDLAAGITRALSDRSVPRPRPVGTGHGAAVAVVRLMARTAGRTDPGAIVRAYVGAGSTGAKAAESLWQQFGAGTTLNMTDGVQTLAVIWQSAWNTGKGGSVPRSAMHGVDKRALQTLYQDPTWVPSVNLDKIATYLLG